MHTPGPKSGQKEDKMETILADKLNPQKLGYSPFMGAIVGAILGYDYGVRDSRGGRLTGLSITSDGFLMGSTTSHETGAFLGAVDDLDTNLAKLVQDANLTPAERQEFAELYKARVLDWRIL
jgi:hypothetical protein